MQKFLAIICGILILSISGIAFAGQESGLYIGGSAGSATTDVSKDTYNFNDSDLGYKIFGGYNFGIIPLIDLGIEGSYADFGNASSTQILNQNVGFSGWDLFGVVGFNLGPIGLFGKAGQVWWNSDSDVSIFNTSGNNMAYGVGLRFQLGSLAIRVEYELFDIDLADVHFITAGVSWTF